MGELFIKWKSTNLSIFGEICPFLVKKKHLFGDFQWKMSKLLFICHFRRFLAQKSPNWLFLVKNRQIGDFCNANRQIGDKQQWHTLVSSQIIIWDQVYTQNPLVEVSKDVYTVVILLCPPYRLGKSDPPSARTQFNVWLYKYICSRIHYIVRSIFNNIAFFTFFQYLLNV